MGSGGEEAKALNAPTPRKEPHSAQSIATMWARRPRITGLWVPKKLEVLPFLRSLPVCEPPQQSLLVQPDRHVTSPLTLKEGDEFGRQTGGNQCLLVLTQQPPQTRCRCTLRLIASCHPQPPSDTGGSFYR